MRHSTRRLTEHLIFYDKFQILPEKVTDAAGLTTLAVYDYRVLQPRQVIDPNGNQSIFVFSPVGLPERGFVRGQSSTEGDLARPGVRMEYGFLAFENSPPENRLPIFVRTIRQIHHDSEIDVPLPYRNETITTVEYSDGFGRLLQTRAQGEDVRFGNEHFGGGEALLPTMQSELPGNDLNGRCNLDPLKPNVVVSGWQSYNNKGHVIEKFEPFFSEGWNYSPPDDSTTGQKMRIFYDPRGYAIRTINPDGSEQLVIFGVPDLEHPETFEPTPWETYTYDPNDNAGRTNSSASAGGGHLFQSDRGHHSNLMAATIPI